MQMVEVEVVEVEVVVEVEEVKVVAMEVEVVAGGSTDLHHCSPDFDALEEPS